MALDTIKAKIVIFELVVSSERIWYKHRTKWKRNIINGENLNGNGFTKRTKWLFHFTLNKKRSRNDNVLKEEKKKINMRSISYVISSTHTPTASIFIWHSFHFFSFLCVYLWNCYAYLSLSWQCFSAIFITEYVIVVFRRIKYEAGIRLSFLSRHCNRFSKWPISAKSWRFFNEITLCFMPFFHVPSQRKEKFSFFFQIPLDSIKFDQFFFFFFKKQTFL